MKLWPVNISRGRVNVCFRHNLFDAADLPAVACLVRMDKEENVDALQREHGPDGVTLSPGAPIDWPARRFVSSLSTDGMAE